MEDTKKYQENQTSVSPKQFTINIWTAFGILGGAILVSIVGTAFTIGRTLNTDHFTLESTAAAVAEIKASYVNKDVYDANQAALISSLRDIKDSQTALTTQLASLINNMGK